MAGRARGQSGQMGAVGRPGSGLFQPVFSPTLGPGSCAQNSKWSMAGDTLLVENEFPFFLLHEAPSESPLVWLSSKRQKKHPL